MQFGRYLCPAILMFALIAPAVAQVAPPAEDKAVRAVLSDQVQNWNRGDLDAFASSYKKSSEILFIGSTVRRGYDGMIASYRKNYPNRTAMGVLSFANLEVHPLDSRFATVLGNFHLERTAAGGGNADGIFSLVMEKTSAGWKIVLDHTSNLPPKPVTSTK